MKRSHETCAHCSLDVAAWRVERRGRVYCSAFCASQGERAPVEVIVRRTLGARGERP